LKALKIWGWILFANTVVLHLVGLFSGEYNRYGWYGTSSAAMMLTIFSVVSLLLAITVLIIAQAIKRSKTDK